MAFVFFGLCERLSALRGVDGGSVDAAVDVKSRFIRGIAAAFFENLIHK